MVISYLLAIFAKAHSAEIFSVDKICVWLKLIYQGSPNGYAAIRALFQFNIIDFASIFHKDDSCESVKRADTKLMSKPEIESNIS